MNSIFPPIELADENGLLAIGGDLCMELLIEAYSHGIFPWPMGDEIPLPWFAPDPRGVLFYKDLHLSRSFLKELKHSPFSVTFNQDFLGVIRNCKSAPYRKESWITEEIEKAYHDLFLNGFGFSVEVYDQNKILVGGIYGIKIKKYYCGESMFYKKQGASKIALVTLMDFLNRQGIEWLDTQMVSPVVKQMGGSLISREKFMIMLENSLS